MRSQEVARRPQDALTRHPRRPQEAPKPTRVPNRPPRSTQDAPRGLGENVKTVSARKPHSLVLQGRWPH
eukprot:4814137-Pyramimonas_sp.AAC.1